jgi:gluconate 2-dehydrogenase gamma chain
MSDISRREALKGLATAFATAGAIDQFVAADAHAMVAQITAVGPYTPKALSAHEYQTLLTLTDFIIPVENNRPGAVQAGVPGWIDSLLAVNADLKKRYSDGLAWIDQAMKTRHKTDFISAVHVQQTGLLDQIAFQKNRSAELNPGIDFFILLRRMTVDGFYTSPIGQRDIYQGNTARAEFTVPRDAMDYVINRSPLK